MGNENQAGWAEDRDVGTSATISGSIIIPDGDNVAEGATTSAASSSTAASTAASETGISLWKGIKNILILLSTVLGIKTGAAVTTDADGTLQQYLRGLIKVFADVWNSTLHTFRIEGVATAVPVPVLGRGFSVQVDFTVDAGAYSIGDALAAMGTFAGMASAAGKRSVINQIVLAPNDAMPALAFNLWLLNADLATPVAKNAAFVIVAADAPKVLGTIPITAADYVPTQISWNIATLRGVGAEVTPVATSVYIYIVCTAVTAPVATHVYLTLSGEFID